jgi:ribonuclease HI
VYYCGCSSVRRAFKRKWILIFSDSWATLKALRSLKVTSGLVAEYLDARCVLAIQNEVTLMWVPGHYGISCDEKADKLARQGAAMPLLGPEPALGIPRCSARETIKN